MLFVIANCLLLNYKIYKKKYNKYRLKAAACNQIQLILSIFHVNRIELVWSSLPIFLFFRGSIETNHKIKFIILDHSNAIELPKKTSKYWKSSDSAHSHVRFVSRSEENFLCTRLLLMALLFNLNCYIIYVIWNRRLFTSKFRFIT